MLMESNYSVLGPRESFFYGGSSFRHMHETSQLSQNNHLLISGHREKAFFEMCIKKPL